MKIALLHSFYSRSQPSGENVVVEAQAAALRESHDVETFFLETDDLSRSRSYAPRAAITVSTGLGPFPLAQIEALAPDIVHIHNLFPNFGRARVKGVSAPIVATLHNFRHTCAAGTFYRDGEPCMDCVEQGSRQSVRHSCYRSSAAATIPLAIALRGGARADPVISRARAVVALSERARSLHELAGVDASKMRVIPNFVETPGPDRVSSVEDEPWLYMGRLSPEKGVAELISAWPAEHRLDVVGEGPLRRELERAAPPSVRFLGAIAHDELQSSLHRFRGLILPSRWAEGAVPLTFVEAISKGLPVIALAGNGASDDILISGCGLVLEDWGRLPKAIAEIGVDYLSFSRAAKNRSATEYTKAAWLSRMSDLYADVIATHSPTDTFKGNQ